jgi:hypothetical protein
MRFTVAKWSFDLSLSARLSIVVALIVTGVVLRSPGWVHHSARHRDRAVVQSA